MDVLIINLAMHAERRIAMLAQLDGQPGLTAHVISGVYGPALPDAVCRLVSAWREHWVSRKGTIGCFLSHVAAWERIAAGENAAVVVEDDVDVSQLWKISDIAIPPDAEIVFVNNRMCIEAPGAPMVTPMLPSLHRLNDQQAGSGGDGYWLTPAGARKILDACSKELYFGHVDGRLLRYTTSRNDLAQFPAETWLGHVLRNHHAWRGDDLPVGIVRGYCLTSALVRQGVLANDSLRNAMDQDV